jgi:hypothetical protein
MARSYRRLLLPVVLLVSAAAGTLEAGNCGCCKQWMGCGYGPGYNAPQQPGAGMFNWGRGCCEVPANWRLHVWDGYHGDPCAYQRSLVGAQPDINHMPQLRVYGGPGYIGHNSGPAGSCSNCQNGGGGYNYQLQTPAAGTLPPASAFQPVTRSGRANSSVRSQR